MTPQEFINTWLGKGIDFDGYYKYQCMDVYQRYNKDVVGAPTVAVPSAAGVWNNYPTAYYDKIENTQDNFPSLGDVIIWGTLIGKYGHIALCAGGNKDSFTSMDQNWPVEGYTDPVTGDFMGTGVCHLQPHNYNGVLGWLRPKNLPAPNEGANIPDMDDYEKAALTDLRTYRPNRVQGPGGNFQGYVDAVIGSDKDLPGVLRERETALVQVSNIQNQLDAQSAVLAARDEAVESMKTQIKTLEEALENIKPQIITQAPVFKNPFAAFLYGLAKKVEG